MFRLLVLIITLVNQKKKILLSSGLLRTASTPLHILPAGGLGVRKDRYLDGAVAPIFGGVTDLVIVDGGKIKWLSSFC
jgi:hypothetical protein